MLAMSAEAASKYFSPVRRIQRAWRRSFKSVAKLLEKYVDPMQLINEGLDYNGLVTLFRREDVKTGIKNLVQRVLRMRVGHQNGEPGEVKTIKSVLFLNSFRVKRFPLHTFERRHLEAPIVMDVRKAASNMLRRWYEVIDALKRDEIPDTLEFRKSFLDYASKYETYRAWDEQFMAKRIQMTLRDLIIERDRLQRTNPAIDEYNDMIRRLRPRLSCLVDGAKMLEAVDAYERVLRNFEPPYV